MTKVYFSYTFGLFPWLTAPKTLKISWNKSNGASFLTVFGLFSSVPEITSEPQGWHGCHAIHNNPLSTMGFMVMRWLLESTQGWGWLPGKPNFEYRDRTFSPISLIFRNTRKTKGWMNHHPWPVILSIMSCLVAQSCRALCYPMDCSPSGSSVHGDSIGKNTGVDCHALLQGIFPTQESNPVPCTAGGFFTIWAIREALINHTYVITPPEK